MTMRRILPLSVILLGGRAMAQDLTTRPLVESPLYDPVAAGTEVRQRIRHGIYEGYVTDLCIDDIRRCHGSTFTAYKKEGSKTGYELTVWRKDWTLLSPEVQD